jgi:exopolysaccharide biosynthesis polyprenyl glycosylphosphotransferase
MTLTSSTPQSPASKHSARAALRTGRTQWQAQYVRRLLISDVAMICGAVVLAQFLRFNMFGKSAILPWTSESAGYLLSSAVLAFMWAGALAFFNTRSRRIIGGGVEEYRRVASATVWLFGVLAILSITFGYELGRSYLGITLILGLAGLMLNRRIWRRVAEKRQLKGQYQTSVLVVGNQHAAVELAANLSGSASRGHCVVGLCTPEGPGHGIDADRSGEQEFPIVGVDSAVMDAVVDTGADTVAVAPTSHLGPSELRKLIWDLDSLGVDLVVTPGLIDVAGRRIGTRLIEGVALLEIEQPLYDRANSWGKRVFDICFAAAALILISPVIVVTAIVVKVSSPGPIFYRSQRIGMNGKPFDMVKVRSMYVGADAELAALIEEKGGQQLFFKVKDDPRVTGVGRFIRKFSIDELPQFINVLRGDMSVVGPRPQVRREVDTYGDLVRRRLFVRPGVTGLWQVSGRSNLSVDAAMRLDLTYVENWSMIQDLVIIVKTFTAVVRGCGAY